MRLALFTDTFAPQMNGVARTLGRLVTETESRGGVVRVFTPNDPRVERTRRGQVRTTASVACPFYRELRIALPRLSSVVESLAEFRPTLVHAATPFGIGIVGRRAAARVGAPFVTSYHTSFSAYARYYGFGLLENPGWHFLRWFHNGGRRTFCPTGAVRSELQEHGFKRLALWGRGVDTARFSPDHRTRAMRLRLDAGDDKVVVAYVGRIAREKGLDSLLGAMAQVRELNRAVIFAFAGDGPYLEQCRRRAPEGTIFLGRLEGEALSAFYASADMLVFPSSTDTFGNVLIEAMASGLPLVAADCATTREIVGGTALLHTPGNAQSLANVILSAMTNAPRRRSLARAARLRAAQFSWRAVFDELFAEYDAAIAGRDQLKLPVARRASQMRYAPPTRA